MSYAGSQVVHLGPHPTVTETHLELVASKSESNRALLMQALSAQPIRLDNLSQARDTHTMRQLLDSTASEWNVLDAGTTMRFLSALLAVADRGEPKVLTGTDRMKQRPLGLLVDALRQLGASVDYLGQEGYPPVRISPLTAQKVNELHIPGNVSSQYISALIMVGPMLPQGLTVHISEPLFSKPYLDMTMSLMKRFGARVGWQGTSILVEPHPYEGGEYTIESDWSAASYWYSLVALAPGASKLHLKGLRKTSFQGDSQMATYAEQLGVKTTYTIGGLTLEKGTVATHFEANLKETPDLGQTLAVMCAALRVPATFTGLESLRIKETDRIAALEQELAKLGARLHEPSAGVWKLEPGDAMPKELTISTYEDHRMAMAFAPLATQTRLTVEQPAVVNKSYPSFWDDLAQVGFDLRFA